MDEHQEASLRFIEDASSSLRYTLEEMDRQRRIAARFETFALEARALLRRLAVLEHVADIKSVYVSQCYEDDTPVEIALHLNEEQKDSPILREIVQAGIVSRIDKAKDYSGQYLNATFKVDHVSVRIVGYVPQTCRVVEEPTVEPAGDAYYVDDAGRIFKRGTKRTVVCTEPEAPTSTTDGVPA